MRKSCIYKITSLQFLPWQTTVPCCSPCQGSKLYTKHVIQTASNAKLRARKVQQTLMLTSGTIFVHSNVYHVISFNNLLLFLLFIHGNIIIKIILQALSL